MATQKEIICSPEAFWHNGPPCVIWGASPEDEGTAFLPYAHRPHFLIAADGGAEKAKKLGLEPDILMGDMDSLADFSFDAEKNVIRLPAEKDDTDLYAAAREGLRRDFRRFLLIGCTGGRLDHFLSVLSVLAFLEQEGAQGLVLSDGNRIFWAKGPFQAVIPNDPAFQYFSLQAMDKTVTDVTIKGAKYPLSDYTLHRESSIGISNEIQGEAAFVSASAGELLIIQSS
ncbi:MAG TPA: thiamine diphosphokinase [Clostridiales bacterium]|nr:thiamine diphosphokinase [Clostridiales bacterium]